MGGGGTGEVTSPPVGTGVTSGGLFSGVVGGGVTETEKKKRRAPLDPFKKRTLIKKTTHVEWEEVGPATSPALLKAPESPAGASFPGS